MPQEEIPLNQEEIRERALKLYETKRAPENPPEQGPSPEERERLKQDLARASQGRPVSTDDAAIKTLSTSLTELDDREQLGRLIEMVFLKGPTMAIRVAESLNKPDVLDSLHDVLASDSLYSRLVKEGKL